MPGHLVNFGNCDIFNLFPNYSSCKIFHAYVLFLGLTIRHATLQVNVYICMSVCIYVYHSYVYILTAWSKIYIRDAPFLPCELIMYTLNMNMKASSSVFNLSAINLFLICMTT